MKKIYKIRNVLHRKIGYLELEITVKALLWASQIASEGEAAGIIEIWTSEPCRQKKINSNWSELLHVFIFHQYEAMSAAWPQSHGWTCCKHVNSVSITSPPCQLYDEVGHYRGRDPVSSDLQIPGPRTLRTEGCVEGYFALIGRAPTFLISHWWRGSKWPFKWILDLIWDMKIFHNFVNPCWVIKMKIKIEFQHLFHTKYDKTRFKIYFLMFLKIWF